MFVPAEPLFSAALQTDPTLFDDAVDQRVVPASPLTLVALLRTVAAAWQQQRLAAGPGTPVDRLRAVAVDVVVTTVENLDDATVFFRSMHLLEPGTRATVRARRRRYHERFRALVDEGQAAGLLRKDVSADLAVHYFFGSVHHLLTWYRPDGPMNASQIGNAFAQLLIDGMAPLPAALGKSVVSAAALPWGPRGPCREPSNGRLSAWANESRIWSDRSRLEQLAANVVLPEAE